MTKFKEIMDTRKSKEITPENLRRHRQAFIKYKQNHPLRKDIERVIELYVNQKCSLTEISKMLKVRRDTIRVILGEYNIPLRNSKEGINVIVQKRRKIQEIQNASH